MGRDTAADRATRLLAILHLLRPGSRLSLDAIADQLGITRAEAAEDLEALSCCGLAPYSPDALVPVLIDGEVAYVWGDLPALDKAIRLSEGQVRAVLAALQAAGLPAEDPLCAKLVAASGDADAAGRIRRVLTSARDDASGEALKAAALATEQGFAMRLIYQGIAEQQSRERIVEPVSLVNERGHWYLEAYARDSGALRTFRLDRVRAAEVLGERTPHRALSPSGTALLTEGLPLALVRLAPGEEMNSRDWPGAEVVSVDDTGTVFTIPYAGTAWIARQIVARLGAAEMLEPAEVADAVRVLALAAAEDSAL